MTAIKHFVEITTKKEFDEFCSDASQLKIIHFYAQWCSACPEMDILLKEFQQEFKGFDVARINAEEVTEISTAHSVTCVPTILFYKKGKLLDKRDGFQPLEIKNLIVKYSMEVDAHTNEVGGTNELSQTEALDVRLKRLINKTRLTVFMKGTADAPKCGFSRQIIEILKSHNTDFWTFDILSDEEVRQGLKTYSDWPTYPQVYLDGELLGGLDVIREEVKDSDFIAKLPKLHS